MKLQLATVGSISHATLRSIDLLNAFAHELEWQIRRNGEYFSRPENFGERDRLNAIVESAWECFDESGDNLDVAKEESGEVDEMVNETLPDALQTFCLPYFYFGSHPGDGADFGFWPIDMDEVKEQVEFSSSKEQEYPDDDFRGEWLHINERGNCTLYVREDADTDKEVWALV